MSEQRLGLAEARFAELIWEREPVGSGELVKLAREELGWQKSTTYTVLKKLCEKGYFRNEEGHVTSLISRRQAADMWRTASADRCRPFWRPLRAAPG